MARNISFMKKDDELIQLRCSFGLLASHSRQEFQNFI